MAKKRKRKVTAGMGKVKSARRPAKNVKATAPAANTKRRRRAGGGYKTSGR